MEKSGSGVDDPRGKKKIDRMYTGREEQQRDSPRFLCIHVRRAPDGFFFFSFLSWSKRRRPVEKWQRLNVQVLYIVLERRCIRQRKSPPHLQSSNLCDKRVRFNAKSLFFVVVVVQRQIGSSRERGFAPKKQFEIILFILT